MARRKGCDVRQRSFEQAEASQSHALAGASRNFTQRSQHPLVSTRHLRPGLVVAPWSAEGSKCEALLLSVAVAVDAAAFFGAVLHAWPRWSRSETKEDLWNH